MGGGGGEGAGGRVRGGWCGVRLGGQGGCEQRIEVFVRIHFFFWGGGRGGGVRSGRGGGQVEGGGSG